MKSPKQNSTCILLDQLHIRSKNYKVLKILFRLFNRFKLYTLGYYILVGFSLVVWLEVKIVLKSTPFIPASCWSLQLSAVGSSTAVSAAVSTVSTIYRYKKYIVRKIRKRIINEFKILIWLNLINIYDFSNMDIVLLMS